MEGKINLQFLKTFESEIGTTKICCDFSPDNKYFATIAGLASSINIYSIETLLRVYKIATHNSFIHSIKFTSQEKYELSVLTCDSKVKFYNLSGDVAKLRGEIPFTHSGFLSSICFTKNHRFILTTGGDKQVKIWDYLLRSNNSSACVKINGHASPIFCSAISKDSKVVYTAGGAEGIYVWDFLGDVDTEMPMEEIGEFLGWNVSDKRSVKESNSREASPYKSLGLKDASPEKKLESERTSEKKAVDMMKTIHTLETLGVIKQKIGTRHQRLEDYNQAELRQTYELLNWENPEFGFVQEDVDRLFSLVEWGNKDFESKEKDLTKLYNLLISIEKLDENKKKERMNMVYDI